MRYLVTGVAGFIASKLTEFLLRNGQRVVGIDNLNKGATHCLRAWHAPQRDILSRCGVRVGRLNISLNAGRVITDVVEMYQVIVQAWFFLTPVIDAKTILPERFVWLKNLNPMYNLLELFRWPIY